MVARALTVFDSAGRRRAVEPLYSLVRRCDACSRWRLGFFQWGWAVWTIGGPGPGMCICSKCASDQEEAAQVCSDTFEAERE
jgi:hypothetical protein